MDMNILLEAVISGALQFDAVLRCRTCGGELYTIAVEKVLPGGDPAVVDDETRKATETLLAHVCVIKLAQDAANKAASAGA